jgi:hypothetical protein
VSASADHRVAHARKSDPSIMVSTNGSDRSKPGHAANEAVQGFEASHPVNQVSTKQDDVRLFLRHDIENAVDDVARAVLSQMEITRE